MGTVPIRFSRVIFECDTLLGVPGFEPLALAPQYEAAVHNCTTLDRGDLEYGTMFLFSYKVLAGP